MQIEIWNIQGQGFHFGKHGLGQEQTSICMPSDSLFAALVSRLAALYGGDSVREFVAPFIEGEPPFVLSSTFPYAGQVHFFPTPAYSPGNRSGISSAVTPKKLKKIAYVSHSLFIRLLDGGALAGLYPHAVSFQEGLVLVAEEELGNLPGEIRSNLSPIWQVEKRPRVKLGRSVQKSTIYFTGRVAYAARCGLWFGVRWLVDDQPLKDLFAQLLADLGDAGLGAERSAGFGACRIEPGGAMELPEAAGTPWVSLSRYLPRRAEMAALDHPSASYRIENVGGWLDSPIRRGQRRRPVNMIASGSILGPLEPEVPGQVVDLRPVYETDPDPLGHPVYRSGITLSIGLRGGGK